MKIRKEKPCSPMGGQRPSSFNYVLEEGRLVSIEEPKDEKLEPKKVIILIIIITAVVLAGVCLAGVDFVTRSVL